MNPAGDPNALAAKFQAAVEEDGRRKTQPRQCIAARLAELSASGQDFCVEALWSDLRRANPRLGRATVFRAVETLVSLGLLDRIEFADGSHTYRACQAGHHHHLTCRKCHRIVDVALCVSPQSLDEIGKTTGFDITGHSMVLFGICPECRE